MMRQNAKQATKQAQQAPMRAAATAVRRVVSSASTAFAGSSLQAASAVSPVFRGTTRRAAVQKVFAIRDGATLDRPLRVAIVGGGPSGSCAAEILAKGGVETFMFERKLDNCKVRI
jgi:geranylgeranyl reductase